MQAVIAHAVALFAVFGPWIFFAPEGYKLFKAYKELRIVIAVGYLGCALMTTGIAYFAWQHLGGYWGF